MACCLTPLIYYINQRWLLINDILWHSPVSNFTLPQVCFCIMSLKTILLNSAATSPRGQWVNIISSVVSVCKIFHIGLIIHHGWLLCLQRGLILFRTGVKNIHVYQVKQYKNRKCRCAFLRWIRCIFMWPLLLTTFHWFRINKEIDQFWSASVSAALVQVVSHKNIVYNSIFTD